MPFGLEFLEEFIQTEIQRKREGHNPLTLQEAQEKLLRVESEVGKLKNRLQTFMFEAKSEIQIENNIQHFQTRLVTLADVLINCRESLPEESNERTMCISTYCYIDDLLKYTQRHYAKYFNQDELAPLAYLWMARHEITKCLHEIDQTPNLIQIDADLLKLALYPLRNFSNSKEKRFTYRSLLYLRQLANDLNAKLAETPATEVLFDQLCYLNYNSFYFLTFITQQISKEVQEQSTLAGQIEKLSFWVKRFNQRQIKPDCAFKRDRPSLQEQVGIWLHEEIYFVEKKKQLTLMFPPTEQVNKPEAFKIVTSLSVPQLAFVVKILKDAGVIKNHNQTDVIKFFAQNFSTEKNKNISAESLRIKYYTAETSAIRSVQELLNKLLQQIKDKN